MDETFAQLSLLTVLLIGSNMTRNGDGGPSASTLSVRMIDEHDTVEGEEMQG
jgi:hypothetical protein